MNLANTLSRLLEDSVSELSDAFLEQIQNLIRL
jgi:hypothetical protein